MNPHARGIAGLRLPKCRANGRRADLPNTWQPLARSAACPEPSPAWARKGTRLEFYTSSSRLRDLRPAKREELRFQARSTHNEAAGALRGGLVRAARRRIPESAAVSSGC